MPRQIVVFALAVILVACAKEAEKPVEIPATQQTVQTAVASAPDTTEAEAEEEEVDSAMLRRGQWQEIHFALLEHAYPKAYAADEIGPGNIHIVPRGRDTLILATMNWNNDVQERAHSDHGYVDLVAASLRKGKFRVLDKVKRIPNGEFGEPRSFDDYMQASTINMYDAQMLPGSGFTRLGKDVWAWMLNDTRGAHGYDASYITVYAFLDGRIQKLGEYLAADQSNGASAKDWHYLSSCVVPMDDRSATVSDLAIIWVHNDNDRDSTRVVTVHPYIPGKGYDFSNHPFANCKNASWKQ